jgi:hypothetical protein
MGSVDTTADQPLVGLGPDAETRLPVVWAERRDRATRAIVVGFLITVQLAWLAAFAFAAYRFLWSP